MKNFDIDQIISSLQSLKDCQPDTSAVLPKSSVKQLIKLSLPIFKAEPILLELESPIKICGLNLNRRHTRSIFRFVACIRLNWIS